MVRGLIAEVPDQMVEALTDGRGPRPDNRGPRPDNRGDNRRPDRGSDKPSFIQPAAEPMMEKSEFSRRSKDRKKVEEIDEFAARKAKLSEKNYQVSIGNVRRRRSLHLRHLRDVEILKDEKILRKLRLQFLRLR